MQRRATRARHPRSYVGAAAEVSDVRTTRSSNNVSPEALVFEDDMLRSRKTPDDRHIISTRVCMHALVESYEKQTKKLTRIYYKK